MRYDDQELFDMKPTVLNRFKNGMTFNEFCTMAINRLKYLVEESTHELDWMQADLNHLRNYRLKAIRFYQQKKGIN